MAGVPLMIHITDTPLPLPEILAFMKPGDIITHCFHGRDHGIMGPEGQLILKEVVEAQRHGIVFDCAHGRGGHFNFPLIEKALDQGFSTGHDLDRPHFRHRVSWTGLRSDDDHVEADAFSG
jgi:dihydroorotase